MLIAPTLSKEETFHLQLNNYFFDVYENCKS